VRIIRIKNHQPIDGDKPKLARQRRRRAVGIHRPPDRGLALPGEVVNQARGRRRRKAAAPKGIERVDAEVPVALRFPARVTEGNRTFVGERRGNRRVRASVAELAAQDRRQVIELTVLFRPQQTGRNSNNVAPS
jgi:hypothetical protein